MLLITKAETNCQHERCGLRIVSPERRRPQATGKKSLAKAARRDLEGIRRQPHAQLTVNDAFRYDVWLLANWAYREQLMISVP